MIVKIHRVKNFPSLINRISFYWCNHWKASLAWGQVRFKWRHHVYALRHYTTGWRFMQDAKEVGGRDN